MSNPTKGPYKLIEDVGMDGSSWVTTYTVRGPGVSWCFLDQNISIYAVEMLNVAYMEGKKVNL